MFTSVSEVLTIFIISAVMIALMMGAVRTSETLVNFTGLHSSTTQKMAILMLTTVRTLNYA
jgi:hypothetical protein